MFEDSDKLKLCDARLQWNTYVGQRSSCDRIDVFPDMPLFLTARANIWLN
jgi:hypothetical protein